jgi:hypothetical protein
MRRRVWSAPGFIVGVWVAVGAAAGGAPDEATVTDAGGKEIRATDLKFGAGTRRLSWLADPNGATEDAKKGPLAVELREPHSTAYAKGIVTYIPVGSLETIKYDYEKQLVTVGVKGVSDPLVGLLGYRGGVNVWTFSGTVEEKATAFSGGAFAKGNVKGVAFTGAKPVPPRAGEPWLIRIDQPKAENPTLKAANLKFLYQYPGGDVLTDTAAVRKGDPFKLDAAVKSFAPLAVDQNTHLAAVEVQVGDAAEAVLVLPLQTEKDGKTGTLVGLVGEVEAGWKLFPLNTIKGMKRPRKD